LRTLILPAALTALGAAAFKCSTAKLRLVVVPAAVPHVVATAMAAMIGPRKEGKTKGAMPWAPDTVVLPAVSTVQLVSAPDMVVASLGGVFAEMTTMTEVRAAGRAIAGSVGQRCWTIKAHRYHVCTLRQRRCVRAVLLIGVRLNHVDSATRSAAALCALPALAGTQKQLLPAIPNELWLLVLGSMRRSELGTAK
jgi:hypothetical protein